MKRLSLSSLLAVAGPGLLFAATSIGSSHIVQSTRAGAMYGTVMITVVLAATLIKYPAFRIANDVYPASGLTILDAYKRQGRWVLWFILAVAVSTLLFATAALGLLSAGLLKVTIGQPDVPTTPLAIGIIFATCLIVVFGRYAALERITKWLIVIMTLITIVAAILSLPNILGDSRATLSPAALDLSGMLFIAALIGWMPVPLDAGVWQSLWIKAKAEQLDTPRPMGAYRMAFNLSFFGALFLAVCFVLIGTGMMYTQNIAPESSSTSFAAQLVQLYVSVFGSYMGPIIGVAAFLTIYSSLLAVLDAGPRTIQGLKSHLFGSAAETAEPKNDERTTLFYISLATLFMGAVLIYLFLLSSLTGFLDFAATVAFVTAPVIAFLNHRAITHAIIPIEHQPGLIMRATSFVCIGIMIAFALGYLYLRFVGI